MTAAGTVGVHLTDSLRDLVDGRRGGISYSRSRYLAAIVQWWKDQGAPPVTPADEAVQQLKTLRVAETAGNFVGVRPPK